MMQQWVDHIQHMLVQHIEANNHALYVHHFELMGIAN